MPDTVEIPYDALEILSPDTARLPLANGLPDAVLSALLMRVIERHAEHQAPGQAVDLASTTIDATASAKAVSETIEFSAHTDRKTRTMLFAGGTAKCAGQVVMTATAVFQLRTS